jgi:hemerythrin superfamily protein
MARARETLDRGDEREHARALRAVARLVFTHAFAEEAVLFPAARRVLPEGDPLTLRIESDHQEVDDVVSDLDGSSRSDPDHAGLVERAFAVLDHDVRTEEDELLPRLQQLLSRRRLQVLGLGWSSCAGSPRPARTRWCPGARRGRRCPPCR